MEEALNPYKKEGAEQVARIRRRHIEATRAAEEKKLGYANVMEDCLKQQIANFEKLLTPNEEIGATLASFGQTIRLRIHRLYSMDPYLIIFEGIIEGSDQRAELAQHCSQINVLFVPLKVPKEENRKPHRVMGFDV